MPRCLIALGGNVGEVERTFDRALELLDDDPQLIVGRRSSLHRTAAVGDASSPSFLNAAAELRTALDPLSLLDRLQAVEQSLGRRREQRWGPRPLDLDLLFHGEAIIEHPRLRVPHPACWYRRFALDPLVEIAAEFVHPEKQLSIEALRSRLLPRPLPIALAGGDAERTAVLAALEPEFPEVAFSHWPRQSRAVSARSGAAIIAWWPGRDAPAFSSLPVVPRLDLSEALGDRST
ncbi:MAG: 2-amino-4-hydroxy-6-hydroxymethyldihydropteridine diphosphokinase, partial [Planctomycetaceae bacterium]